MKHANLAQDGQEILRNRLTQIGQSASFEATPREIRGDHSWIAKVPRNARIYIPHAAGTSPHVIAQAAAVVRAAQRTPVPHIAARRLASMGELVELLERLRAGGCEEAFLIAGSVARPMSELTSAIDLLDTGLFRKYGFRRIGLAGHPEGSPDVPNAALWQALGEKSRIARSATFGVHVVTQFCFEPGAIEEWEQLARERGIDLPVHVGVPGLTGMGRLLRFAAMCGVRASFGYALHGPSGIGAALSRWSPAPMLLRIAEYMASQPLSLLRQVHFFPFGGLRATIAWAKALGDGRFNIQPGPAGFSMAVVAEAV